MRVGDWVQRVYRTDHCPKTCEPLGYTETFPLSHEKFTVIRIEGEDFIVIRSNTTGKPETILRKGFDFRIPFDFLYPVPAPDLTLDDFEVCTPLLYVNVYLHDKTWGGPEEGGWWYHIFSPEHNECLQCFTLEAAEERFKEMEEWCAEENKCRRSDINSVISEGRYEVKLEAWPAVYYPSERPRYE